MKNCILLLLILIAFFCASAQSPRPPKPPTASESDAATADLITNAASDIHTAWVQILEAMEHGEADTIGDFFTEEGEYLIPHFMPEKGKEAVTLYHEEIFEEGSISNVSHQSIELEVLKNIAVEYGFLDQTIVTYGGTPERQHLRFIAIWRIEEDQWLIHKLMLQESPK